MSDAGPGLGPGEPVLRLFFALWPDEEERAALVRATAASVAACGGRPVPAQNLHLTLAFLGAVPAVRLPELQVIARLAACVPQSPLPLTLGPLAYWRKAAILCALVQEPHAHGVAAFAAALTQHLAAAGFVPELRRFRAHVTVARKVTQAAQQPAVAALSWRCESFALIASRTDATRSVYSVVESYPLVKRGKVRE